MCVKIFFSLAFSAACVLTPPKNEQYICFAPMQPLQFFFVHNFFLIFLAYMGQKLYLCIVIKGNAETGNLLGNNQTHTFNDTYDNGNNMFALHIGCGGSVFCYSRQPCFWHRPSVFIIHSQGLAPFF